MTRSGRINGCPALYTMYVCFDFSVQFHEPDTNDTFLGQTEIYRKVFHAVPDDSISTWKQYKDFVAFHDRLAKPVSRSYQSLK